MPEAPVPQDAPQDPQGSGGGVSEVIVEVDKKLFQLTQLVSENPQVPDEVKAGLQSSLDAYRGAIDMLMQAAGGGGEAPAAAPEGPQAQGVVTPEQGAGRAVPMTMGRPQ